MSSIRRALTVGAAGVAPSLVPGFMAYGALEFPWMLLYATVFAIGAGALAAVLGWIALFAGRSRPDAGLRPALIVATIAGVLIACVAAYGRS